MLWNRVSKCKSFPKEDLKPIRLRFGLSTGVLEGCAREEVGLVHPGSTSPGIRPCALPVRPFRTGQWLLVGYAPSAVLCPVLGSPLQER